MNNGNKKIEENTEYSIIMPDGKVQKFAYYGEKENGRLILLNTKYGTLTSMGASYFLKLISGKYRCTKRPYKVQYPEGYENAKASNVTSSQKKVAINDDHKVKIDENKETQQMLKWATRLKTLPDFEQEIIAKDLRIKPYNLGVNIENWINGHYDGSNIELIAKYEQIRKLLKGTEWDIR